MKTPNARMLIEERFDDSDDEDHDPLVDDADDRIAASSWPAIDETELFAMKLIFLVYSIIEFVNILTYYAAVEWSDKFSYCCLLMCATILIWYTDWSSLY